MFTPSPISTKVLNTFDTKRKLLFYNNNNNHHHYYYYYYYYYKEGFTSRKTYDLL